MPWPGHSIGGKALHVRFPLGTKISSDPPEALSLIMRLELSPGWLGKLGPGLSAISSFRIYTTNEVWEF
jgi:hypothetical protein